MRLAVSVLMGLGALVQAPTTTLHLDNSGGRPSILPRPGEDESPTNAIGFIIVAVLFVIWIGGMVLMFRRAARRRRLATGAT